MCRFVSGNCNVKTQAGIMETQTQTGIRRETNQERTRNRRTQLDNKAMTEDWHTVMPYAVGLLQNAKKKIYWHDLKEENKKKAFY